MRKRFLSVCKMQNENILSDKRFLLTLTKNLFTIEGLHFYASGRSAPAHD